MTSGDSSSVENDSIAKSVPATRRFRPLAEIGFSAFSFLTIGIFGAVAAQAQVNVTTWHNDIGRTGQNLNETILTTSNVNATQFGKLFSQSVDGQVYTQPLYLSGITVNGATHNVIFVATQGDSVYAFDADSNGGANSSPLWHASMLTSAHGAAAGATTVPSSIIGFDIQPQAGITGTPVIDPATGTLYVVSASVEGGTVVQRLHALDVTTGLEKFNGPKVITASINGTGNGSVNGTLTFDPEWENQRPALLLLNGIVYVGFAAHGDNGPWHGWILSYNAATLAQTGTYCASPNGTGSGFWMSGAGLAADQLNPSAQPFGRMFVPTGNGDFNATKPYTTSMDYGDSVLNLNLANGAFSVTDEFTTYLQSQFDSEDGDVASGGLMVLPTQTTGSVPNLAVQAGKEGWIYLLNRDNLGGYSTSADSIVQELNFVVGNLGAWSSPAYWNGNVYYWGVYDFLKSFALTNGKLATTPTKSSEKYGFPGATPSISANGTTNGILWSVDTENYDNPGPAILQAHSASNVVTTLYSSTTNATRDTAGNAVKFAVPTIVNGKVYIGAAGEVDVYGLLSGASQTNTPTFTPGSQSFTSSVTVTLADSTANSSIYYTTDGSNATTSSSLYSQPITLTATTTIHAIGTANGLLTSAQASATYTNAGQANPVTFSLPTGTYTSAQTLTLTDTTAGAAIHYTIDGSTPTASSTLYTGSIAIGSTETVSAIAVASGMGNSSVVAQTYTINIGATGISFGQGFANSSSSMILNGSTQLNDTRLQLTDGLVNEAGTAWFKSPVNIQKFTNDFTFQLSNPVASGITFAIQNSPSGSAALGAIGTSLGYAPIPNSIAIKFDFNTPVGNGADSTGMYLNGAHPTTPAIDLSGTGINLASDDEMAAHMVYDGTTFTMTITDLVTSATWTGSGAVDIPSTIGSSTAYVGFTGSTSTGTASQKILTWSFVSNSTLSAAAMPTFSPAAGSYNGVQSVTISDATPNAIIYYTTNGSTPTIGSTVYSSPISVASSQTLKAIAIATGFSSSAVATAAYTITLPAAATPAFSVAAGTYTSAQSVSITDSTPGATIYYTINGSTPTTSSSVYSGAIPVSSSETLKAIAVATGFTNSAVASAAYTINVSSQIIAPPTFSVPAGTYNSIQTVTITDTTPGTTIRYLLNGSVPTPTQSLLYTGPVRIANSAPLQAIAVTSSGTQSTVTAATYNLVASAPVFSPPSGTYPGPVTVTITSATPTAKIAYTPDGKSPTVFATYTAPITISATGKVYALALETGFTNSLTSVATYNIGPAAAKPAFSVAAGTYTTAQTVSISDATPGATVYYTMDGSTPTNSSLVYSKPIAVGSSVTVNATALASGFSYSAVATAAYSILLPAATPKFSVPAGIYTTAQTVAITDTTPGATMYYTTNGATPTTSSSKYSVPITVSTSETLSAIATASGYSTSAVGTSGYQIGSTVIAPPTFSVPAGTYNSIQTVTITDATPGTTIRYLLNGSVPTPTQSLLYTGPVRVANSAPLQAIAVTSSGAQSTVTAATYNLAASAPVFSPPSGTYPGPLKVTITSATTTAGIAYTPNGNTPSVFASYTAPITVTASGKVYALAKETGFTDSPTIVATYTIEAPAATPTFSIGTGTYTGTQTATISDATPGATIYYTVDGSTPTISSTVYSGAISIPSSRTLSAIAVANSFSNSAVATAVYTIKAPL